MIRPTLTFSLAALLVACGGDPEARPDVVMDASGSIFDLGGLDVLPPDAQLPFDVQLGDGGTLPDGFLEDLLPPDRPPADASMPTDGPRSRYTCPAMRGIRRVAQPATMVNAGPLGTMTVYQAPTAASSDGTHVYYGARDAVGWGIRRVAATGMADEVVLRTDGPNSHVAVANGRVVFRPAGDASSIESVDLRGGGRRVEFRSVAIADGLVEETRPFATASARFALAIRTMDGARGDRFLLIRKRDDGAEEVIFSRRRGTAVFMPKFAVVQNQAVIATTRSDASTEQGLLLVPLDRPALADPSAMQDDAMLPFVTYATLFGPATGPGGSACVGSCVSLAASSTDLYCVRLSGCAPDTAPTLRRYPVPNERDTSGLTMSNGTVYDLAAMVDARGPASVGSITSAPGAPGVYVLMNLPAPGPGRRRHDLLLVGATPSAVTPIACDIPSVVAFGAGALSVNGANEPDEWWGVWAWDVR